MPHWSLIRDLGDSAFLIVVVSGVLASLVTGRELRLAARWALALAVAVGLVAATKVAFFGWGIGIRALDFTCISGHATLSAAIYPVFGRWAFSGLGDRAAMRASLGGAALAVVIGIASVLTGAHSIAEVVAGLVLGSLVAVIALAEPAPPLRSALATVVIALAMTIFGAHAFGHRAEVGQGLMSLASHLSGQPPYTRATWLTQTSGG
jgi:membrane-associated phospholipid phosphatase